MFMRFFFENRVEGWTTLMVVILFCSGIQLMFTGLIGEYIWRNLSQSRNIPMYIVEK